MEAGFLDFHDGEHFPDFSLSLDHQHNLLGDPQGELAQLIDNDFDYVESLELDPNEILWETEQELNGDLAVLPVSGVAGVIPKMENIKEDFAKVLTDWQEHIGYLQASEAEDDINLDMGLHINGDLSVDTPIIEKNSPKKLQKSVKSSKNISSVSGKKEKFPKLEKNLINTVSSNKTYDNDSLSESDQSEKEIDVVGLDSVTDVKSTFDFMHVRRQHATSPSKEYNSKILGQKPIKLKQEPLNSIVKQEPMEFEDEKFPPIEPLKISLKGEYKITNKKKSLKRNEEDSNKKIRKSLKNIDSEKIIKKVKKEGKTEKLVLEKNAPNVPSSHKTPALEAGDVTSLLEQFEATEAAAASPSTLTQVPSDKISSKSLVNKLETTLKKSVDANQDSRLHKDIRDSLPKEIIDRIKASSRKKVISVIPAIPNNKPRSRNSGTRMQEAGATLSRNKLLKLVSNSNGRSEVSIQLDHDYCSNTLKNNKNSSCTSAKSKINSHKNITVSRKNWSDTSSKKDSGLESGDVSDASEEHLPSSKRKNSPLHQEPSTEVKKPLSHISVLDSSKKISLINKPPSNSPVKPVFEMKIQSALATSIMQLRQGVLTKTKSFDASPKVTQMVSVLKNPPAATTPQKVLGNLKESIVTTVNSSNSPVQNIIIQEAVDIDMPEETEKKPPRRKLNLAEYRSRREQTRSDGSRTNSPVQPMALVYIHHVSTNTDPINGDSENPIWSEREIVSVLKPKAEIEEEKSKAKPKTVDRGIQTNETVFGVYVDEYKNDDLESQNDQNKVPAAIDSIVENSIVNIMIKNEVQNSTEPTSGIHVVSNPETASNEVSWKNISVNSTTSPTVDNVAVSNKKLVDNDLDVIINNNKAIKNSEIVPTSSKTSDCEIVLIDNEKLDNNDEIIVISEDKEAESDKKLQKSSVSRINERKNRNYRRARASLSSSRSRSRSKSRSRNRKVRSRRSRSRSRNDSRSHSRSRSLSRSRGKSRDNHGRGRYRSSSPSSSRSRSRSRSSERRRLSSRNQRRRKISHRRSSVSSMSSYSSRSRSRSRSMSRSRSRLRYRSSSRSSRSRSRSRSRYSSSSRCSSRSKWSTRQWKGRQYLRQSYDRRIRNSSGSSHGHSDYRRRPYDEYYLKEKQRQVEERRVIYVGRLKEGITKVELRRRFEVFGPVVDISIHFRERGHNYGFVTFAYKNDAYQAVEHGNDDPSLPRYDLCFGGRRAFCKVKYADLDGAATNSIGSTRNLYKPEEENTFDMLLKEAQAKLRKRKV